MTLKFDHITVTMATMDYGFMNSQYVFKIYWVEILERLSSESNITKCDDWPAFQLNKFINHFISILVV